MFCAKCTSLQDPIDMIESAFLLLLIYYLSVTFLFKNEKRESILHQPSLYDLIDWHFLVLANPLLIFDLHFE